MSLFPSTPVPSFSVAITARWKTIQSNTDMGRPQRRQKWVQPRYDVDLRYDRLVTTGIRTYWQFYQACRGSLESFNFHDLDIDNWYEVYVSIGDGSTVTFDIPGISTSAHLVYLNGVLQSSGDYTILTGGGEENADRITFDSAPAKNTIITCTFTGYLQILCHFLEDKLTREQFANRLYRTGLKLEGLPR